MLVKPSTDGRRPGYRSAAFQSARSRSMSSGRSKSTGSSFSNQGSGDDNRQTYSAIQTQTGKVKGGGKGIGTDKRGNVVFEDDRPSQKAIDNAKKFQEEQKRKREEAIKRSRSFNPFPITTSVLDKISNSKLAKYNNLLQRNNYFRTLNTDQQVALLEALAREEEIGTLNPMGITRNIDRGLEEGILGIGGGKFITDIDFGGKDAKEVINKTIEQYNKDLAEGKLDKNASVVLGDDQPALTYDEYLEDLTTRFSPGPSDDPTDPCLGPNPPAYCFVKQDPTTPTTPTPTRNLGGLAPRFAGSIFDFTGLADGGRVPAMSGGIMNTDVIGGAADGNIDEMGRQMYFVGKLVKKATRAIKKVVKSPLGKAALLGGAMYFGGGGKGLASFFGKGSFNPLRMAAAATSDGPMTQLSPLGQLLSKFGMATGEGGGKLTLGGKIGLGFGIPFALDLLGVGKDDDKKMDLDEYYRTQGINIADIRNRPYNFLADRFTGSRFAADGGLMRMGYQEGGDAEPVAKKTMPLIDMDGKEKDYRETGGFVDMGRMERADDVPARLSKNEFVFTADAVRNAGEGDIDKGAEVMYNMMKNLEAGGEVSEESQGLEGAREMFQTSQRLGEVI